MKYYVEIVDGKTRHPRQDPQPVISSFREATEEEITSAKVSFDNGECDHTLFEDEAGWLYDVRKCKLCGDFISLI